MDSASSGFPFRERWYLAHGQKRGCGLRQRQGCVSESTSEDTPHTVLTYFIGRVRRLRLWAPNAGDPGLVPGQGTGSHVPQLRVGMQQLNPEMLALSNDALSCPVGTRGALLAPSEGLS